MMLKPPLILVALALAAAAPHAQTRGSRAIVVTETTGIRRTEYPVSARIELARGTLRDAANARLRFGEADVPAQFTGATKWDDGSARVVDVDFNVSIGPGESRTYQLEYGGDIAATPITRGLAVTETGDAIQVGSIRFAKSGAPLVLSASYVKSEFIGKGANGLTVVDGTEARHDLSTAQQLSVELQKRGPLSAVVRYTGRLPFDAGYSASFVLMIDMPNSKSWVKMSATVQDPGRRVRRIVFDSPLAFTAFPLTWDFGTENNTYGAFRNAADAAVLTQTVTAKGAAGWMVETGAEGKLQPYERSVAGRSPLANGWGHVLDARGAVAFAVDRFGRDPGTYSIALNGQGRATFSFAPAQPATEHRLTVYQHFVSTPVPIGAATNPTAMLSPLRVEIKGR
jgi:hypothetical protein